MEPSTPAVSQFASDVVGVQQPSEQKQSKSPAVAAVYPFAPFYPAMSPALQTASVSLASAISVTTSVPTATTSASANTLSNSSNKLSTVVVPSPVIQASYPKPYVALPARRTFAAPPTFLIRNGHKVQCVMVPQRSMPANTIIQQPADDEVSSLRSASSTPVSQV